MCKDEDIVIVGGGNSAGQAAVFLASTCKHVHLLVRASGLSESMSRYLIRRIEDTPNITLRARTEITAPRGRLEPRAGDLALRAGRPHRDDYPSITYSS